ncbi:hypothetical protein GOP47_0012337, partial [Adiantum capillus-veneris]
YFFTRTPVGLMNNTPFLNKSIKSSRRPGDFRPNLNVVITFLAAMVKSIINFVWFF